jgi:hypothetical protein
MQHLSGRRHRRVEEGGEAELPVDGGELGLVDVAEGAQSGQEMMDPVECFRAGSLPPVA